MGNGSDTGKVVAMEYLTDAKGAKKDVKAAKISGTPISWEGSRKGSVEARDAVDAKVCHTFRSTYSLVSHLPSLLHQPAKRPRPRLQPKPSDKPSPVKQTA
jgi:hypothetical protein